MARGLQGERAVGYGRGGRQGRQGEGQGGGGEERARGVHAPRCPRAHIIQFQIILELLGKVREASRPCAPERGPGAP
ncbi:MAG: hypothetical protein EB832_04900 [Thaumarchaeota archaeon S14]|nr:MAG: hypothetical protein EB832_04900 [Thaumarchaeota archaeon S14]